MNRHPIGHVTQDVLRVSSNGLHIIVQLLILRKPALGFYHQHKTLASKGKISLFYGLDRPHDCLFPVLFTYVVRVGCLDLQHVFLSDLQKFDPSELPSVELLPIKFELLMPRSW
jgi:hypothetical protein